MSTNEYPVFWESTLLGTAESLIYTVPTGGLQSLQDLQIKLTNTSGTAATATVYAVPDRVDDSGDHDGSDNASVLTDSTQSWTTDEWVGYVVKNTTDGSQGEITANTATTVTATLAGGSENDWDTSDEYEIVPDTTKDTEVVPTQSIPANDYILVPIERVNSGGKIYAKSGTADVVNIQAIGGKLFSV